MAGDATGLENIRICGALWGLTRRQIEAGLDDVTQFTELGDFLKCRCDLLTRVCNCDLPFAIATLREPDILLLDEVIGVGDASFYQKAFDRLLNLVRKSGFLFVASPTHTASSNNCGNKAIWLHNGSLIAYGDVAAVLGRI